MHKNMQNKGIYLVVSKKNSTFEHLPWVEHV